MIMRLVFVIALLTLFSCSNKKMSTRENDPRGDL